MDLPIPAPIDDERLAVEVELHDTRPNPTAEVDRTPWEPTDDLAAEWVAHRLVESLVRLREIEADVDRYVELVAQWAKEQRTSGEAGKLTRSIRFFEDRLRFYALNRRELSPRDRKGEPTVKSVRLPSATIQTRKVGGKNPKVVVVDEAALLAWAKENVPVAIKVTETVIVDALGTHRKDDNLSVYDNQGEVIPGLMWDPGVEARVEAYVEPTTLALESRRG